MDKEAIASAARVAIDPLKPADSTTHLPRDMFFKAEETEAGRSLPPYYLVYFLLVDLLGFTDIGRSEKIAWSVPVDFRGMGFLIEHRKLGLGIFAQDADRDEAAAAAISQCISRATSAAAPYFEHLADIAADGSDLNVVNKSRQLYDGHEYFIKKYEAQICGGRETKGRGSSHSTQNTYALPTSSDSIPTRSRMAG